MKAKVIREPYRLANLSVGEVVEIIPGMETDAEGIWNVPAGKLVLCKKGDGTFCYSSLLDMEIVDESPSVDWDAFRMEAAKIAMLGLLAGGRTYPDIEYVCSASVRYADELINELINRLMEEEE